MIRGINAVMRTAAFALILCCIGGCCEQQRDTTLIHTSVNAAGEFWATVNDGESRRLLQEAQAYRPVLSPDGDWLAVEVRLMSDLSVVRLFQRVGETLVATDPDITTRAWHWALAGTDVQLGELSHARTLVAGWDSDAQTLLLVLSATLPDDEPFETVITLPLDQEP